MTFHARMCQEFTSKMKVQVLRYYGMDAHKFTPILMLTTESSDDKKKEGQGAGATGWVVKPFNPEQMLATIKKVMPG